MKGIEQIDEDTKSKRKPKEPAMQEEEEEAETEEGEEEENEVNSVELLPFEQEMNCSPQLWPWWTMMKKKTTRKNPTLTIHPKDRCSHIDILSLLFVFYAILL